MCTAVCGNHNLREQLTDSCAGPAMLSELGCPPHPHPLRYMHSAGMAHRAVAVSRACMSRWVLAALAKPSAR